MTERYRCLDCRRLLDPEDVHTESAGLADAAVADSEQTVDKCGYCGGTEVERFTAESVYNIITEIGNFFKGKRWRMMEHVHRDIDAIQIWVEEHE